MWRLSCVVLTVVILTLCLGGTTAQQLVTCGTGTCGDGWNFADNGYSGYDPAYEGGVIAFGTAGAPATSSQTLATQIGLSYTYSFDLWSFLSNGESFIARWGSTTLLSLTTEFYPSPVTYTHSHFDFDHALLRIPTGMLLLAARQRVGDAYPVAYALQLAHPVKHALQLADAVEHALQLADAVEHPLQLAHQLAHPVEHALQLADAVEHAHELAHQYALTDRHLVPDQFADQQPVAHELAHQYALVDQHLVPDQLADQQPVGLALWFALALELGLAQQLALWFALALELSLAQQLALAFVQRFAQ